jgi:hypothetical protein
MSDLDRLIKELQLAREKLGRTPRRPEFLQMAKCEPADIIRATGGCGYQRLVELSGLKFAAVAKVDKQEVRKQVFDKIQSEAEKRRIVEPPTLIHNLLCISDQHEPYSHPDKTAFVLAVADKYGMISALIGGDEIDHHGMSFHDKDPDLLSPGHELEAAIRGLEPIYKRFPKAYVLSSNHGDMVYRKGKHHGLPRAVLRDYNEVLQAPKGWEWRESWTLQMSNGKKLYSTHGIGKNYLAVAQQLGMNFVQFHFHNELGLRFWTVNGETFFAIQSGCLVDDASLAMAYNKHSLGRPVMGISGIVDGLPRLFPMLTDKFGRWNGVIP